MVTNFLPNYVPIYRQKQLLMEMPWLLLYEKLSVKNVVVRLLYNISNVKMIETFKLMITCVYRQRHCHNVQLAQTISTIQFQQEECSQLSVTVTKAAWCVCVLSH